MSDVPLSGAKGRDALSSFFTMFLPRLFFLFVHSVSEEIGTPYQKQTPLSRWRLNRGSRDKSRESRRVAEKQNSTRRGTRTASTYSRYATRVLSVCPDTQR